jgi:immune inhibitor A
MRKAIAGLVACSLGLSLVAVTVNPAGAAPPDDAAPAGAPASQEPTTAFADSLPDPTQDKREALREEAITQVLTGQATPVEINGSTVVQVGEQAGADQSRRDGRDRRPRKDQYVELARERTDRVFTLLVEFGNERHPDYPDVDTDPNTVGPARFDGPLHNEIPEPDRTVDNSTIWEPDFSQEFFQDLYFGTGRDVESLKTYYETQSSGRYSIDGEVSAWTKVRFNEARYGRSNGFPCGGIVCSNTWNLVQDGMNQWVADQQAAGRSAAEIRGELASYDIWDRNDFDGDGNFNEADGYIDHLQIVHSGGDQADGDPHQGEDAIWSHRWHAFVSDIGLTGPGENLDGGTEIADTGIWASDYTIQPENGGLSTIAHEYGHDLDLPDHYDTAGGQNGVEWWTLMAQSRLSDEDEPIGTRPGDLSAWDKLQLGWLNYTVTNPGESRTIRLGPHEFNTRNPQGIVTVLPPKEVTDSYGEPFAGERFWWSTKGDDLTTSMTRPVDLTGKTTAHLDLQARFEIEADFDYLYVQASTDGGATWSFLDGTVGGAPFVRDGSGNPAISGSSGGAWLPVNVPLDAHAGQAISLRLLYRTDGGVAPNGFFADEIVVTADGQPVFTSGAEDGDEGWTLDGFRSTTGTETNEFPHFYISSNRIYASYDRYLETGPYNFGFGPARPDWVEHFSYQEGLLISYWDTSQPDNNTSEHPGQGEILPIDSHPTPILNGNGTPWRSRIQVYDATFSRERADSFTLHISGVPHRIRGAAGQPVFDDSRSYWDPALPQVGVKVPNEGVRIRVVDAEDTWMVVRVRG